MNNIHEVTMTAINEDYFLREPEVRRLSGLSRTTRWRLEQKGKFPQRRQISENAVGWLASEINQWITQRAKVGGVDDPTASEAV